MAGITPQQEAEVQETLRHLPDLPHLRLKSKDWSADVFKYARSRIDVDCHLSIRGRAYAELELVRSERAQEYATNARHAEIKGQLEALKEPKFHWSTTPTFWVVLATLFIAILAWMFPRH